MSDQRACIETHRSVAGAARPLLELLERPRRSAYALSLAVLSFGLSAWIAAVLFDRLPTSVDAMVQLLHARALLAGGLALPVDAEAAWAVQNGEYLVADFLLEHGSDINTRWSTHECLASTILVHRRQLLLCIANGG